MHPFTMTLASHGGAGRPSETLLATVPAKDDLDSRPGAAKLGLQAAATSKAEQDPARQN